MIRKIIIDVSNTEHYQKYTFYVKEGQILDVYYQGKSKQSGSGFADFVDVKHVPEYIMRAFLPQKDELCQP